MKTPQVTAAAIAFAAVANLAPAVAEELPASGANAWQTMPQVADSQGPAALVTAPHYEWQYHYAGRHPRYEGRWVLVQ